MPVTWLHVSDFHFRGGDSYDRDVVLRGLVESVRFFREKRGRKPDLIFATGDIAHGGKASEYKLATKFFDDLRAAAGVEKQHLFIVPGNHDVDREVGEALKRTLESEEKSSQYFAPSKPKPHITLKQAAYRDWYNGYFKGIRTFPEDTTCCLVDPIDIGSVKISVLLLNSALFCQDDEDHDKLWIGRRCLDSVTEGLADSDAALKLTLVHHPLDWLNGIERPNIKTDLSSAVDLILRGHLHEVEIESVAGVTGEVLHLAAGASYQTRKWPMRALYGTFDGASVTIFPIRYEDTPREVWRVDPSVFPDEDGHQKSYAVPRLAKNKAARPPTEPIPPAAVPAQPATAPLPRFRSNIPARGSRPFVGREDDLARIRAALGDSTQGRVLVLHGVAGVGKSELGREFGRLEKDRYPGGTFFIDASAGEAPIDLALIGRTILGLSFSADQPLREQCLGTLHSLGEAPFLLIYDNARSTDAIQPWLPPSGMPGHVLITTLNERWDGWEAIEIEPLAEAPALDLVRALGGAEVETRFGKELAATGLPVQIVPMATSLGYEARRGRLDAAKMSLAKETTQSFRAVYDRLGAPAQLLLQATALLNSQRISTEELQSHLAEGAGWDEPTFLRALDACVDLHLLDGTTELKLHQLIARFLLDAPTAPTNEEPLRKVRQAQRRRFAAMGREVADHPANAELAGALLGFVLDPEQWQRLGAEVAIDDGESIGRALYEIGQFTAARPWYERAVKVKEKGDAKGRIDHQSLGSSLHRFGYCLSSIGDYAAARPWYERAVEEKQKGDIQGRIDHESVGLSLHCVGHCLSSTGDFAGAQPWYEQAVAEQQRGDIDGQVNPAGLGKSLNQVGSCLSATGDFTRARPWYERAVDETQKGDLHGRVDHQSLGTSLHQVGYCLSETGDFVGARPWYERAVEEKQKGDIHGRVNHTELGKSLRRSGMCWSLAGDHKAARSWYERAVTAAEKGDIHGRVNHETLRLAMTSLAKCLCELGEEAEAKTWEDRAAKLTA